MNENQEKSFWQKVRDLWAWAYRLRSVVLAVPVAAAAVILAIRNFATLPELVMLETAGSEKGQLVFESITMSRNMAVVMPLSITAVCILLMFCSKKVLYPWLVSLFSLAFPIALQFINTFP